MKDWLPTLQKAKTVGIFRDAIKPGDLMRAPNGALFRVKNFDVLGEPQLAEIRPEQIIDGTKYHTKGPSRYLAGWTLYTYKDDGLGRAIDRLQ